MMNDLERQARIEQLRKEREEREAQRQREVEQQELDGLELDAKLEQELGPRRREFDLLDCRNVGEGWIAVKRATAAQMKRYEAAVDKANTDKRPIAAGETQALVLGCLVQPARDTFLAIIDRRPGIATECAVLILNMASSRKEEAAGK